MKLYAFAIALSAALVLAGLLGAAGAGPAGAAAGATDRYVVVFAATESSDGSYAVDTAAARYAVTAAGGTVATDLSKQIGVLVAESPSAAFADALRASPLVAEVGQDFSWKAFASKEEILASGATVISSPRGGGGPESHADPLETQQWSMQLIRAPQAHAQRQVGWRAVDVGILDTGIDAGHPDFADDGLPGGSTNVDCARGHNSISFLPAGPGVGTPAVCVDNQFHGTHVAGIVAAQANAVGVAGVAPNVTLVPVKVCDASGFCYASAVVDGITYAGDQQLDVINMSFFVDDDEFQQSTEFKCNSDPKQRAFRTSVERAVKYARGRGVTPVAALGNSDANLEEPKGCDVIPAETPGVVGVTSLGPRSEKAGYSNYGAGAADVAAPGGNGRTGDCATTVLSAFPGGGYICIQGTSMASPHAAGLAALIASQYGRLGSDGDVKLSPSSVQDRMQSSAVDIGLLGYDRCFGHGRIDALRAAAGDTSKVYDGSAPFCAEYSE
jgi:subtilisin family serine protease